MEEEEKEGMEPAIRYRNTHIRRKAWQIFRENYGAVLRLGFVMALCAIPASFVLLFPMPAWMIVVTFLALTVLFAPVTVVGYAWAMLRLWRGEASGMGDLFAFIRPAARPLKAWALYLLEMGAYCGIGVGGIWLSAVVFSVLSFVTDGSPSVAILLIGIAASLCGAYYIFARLQLFPYIFSLAPEKGVWQTWRESMRATKGNVRHILGMLVMTIWPYIIASICQYALYRRGVVTYPYLQIVTLLLTLFYRGYAGIGMAGLAETLLREEGE